jgi:hypothetical protein
MSAAKPRRVQTQRRPRRKNTAVAEAAARRRAKVAPKAPPVGPVKVLYRFCKPGWAVIVEKTPHAQGTRFLCPFCPLSHRVSGPVRGFRKMRRAPWIRLRRVEE